MKKILILTTIAVFFSCSSDGGSTATTSSSYALQNVPSNLSVSMSKSLTGKGTTSAEAAFQAEGEIAAEEADSNSYLYKLLRNDVAMASQFLGDVLIGIVLLDEGINTATSGQCVDNYTVSVTPEKIAKIKEWLDEINQTSPEMTAWLDTLSGDLTTADLKGPAYTITDIDKGGFKKEIKLTANFNSDFTFAATCDANPQYTSLLRTNENKTKSHFIALMTETMNGVTYDMGAQISYDSATNKSTFKVNGKMTVAGTVSKFSDRIALRTCTSTEAQNTTGDCNVADFDVSMQFTDTSAKTFVTKVKGSGKSDDSGGFLKGKVSYTDNTTGANSFTEWYKEAWAGNGASTYVGYSSTENGTYTSVVGSDSAVDADYVDDSYDSVDPWSYTPSSAITSDGIYYIVITGANPITDDSAIVGQGFKDSAVDATTLDWEFWGAGDGTYDLYTYDYVNDTATKLSQTLTIAPQ